VFLPTQFKQGSPTAHYPYVHYASLVHTIKPNKNQGGTSQPFLLRNSS